MRPLSCIASYAGGSRGGLFPGTIRIAIGFRKGWAQSCNRSLTSGGGCWPVTWEASPAATTAAYRVAERAGRISGVDKGRIRSAGKQARAVGRPIGLPVIWA